MRLQFRGCPFLTHQGVKMREQLRNVMHYFKNYKKPQNCNLIFTPWWVENGWTQNYNLIFTPWWVKNGQPQNCNLIFTPWWVKNGWTQNCNLIFTPLWVKNRQPQNCNLIFTPSWWVLSQDNVSEVYFIKNKKKTEPQKSAPHFHSFWGCYNF